MKEKASRPAAGGDADQGCRGTAGKKLGIGILGCSSIARRRFLPALLKANNAVLTAVGSRDTERAKDFYAAGSHEVTDYQGLLANPCVDVAYISVPNDLHEEWTVKALDHGKHVICEKPLGLSPGSVSRMTAHARKKGLLLYENIMYLHHPQHRKVKELIGSGVIGTVRSLRASFGFNLNGHSGFRLQPEQGGGAFHDLARYPLSTALLFLAGKSYRFSGYAFNRGNLNVGMNVCAATSAGESLAFSIGFEQQYECWYEIIGEKGKIRLERAYTTPAELENSIEVSAGEERRSIPVPAADHFTLMIEHVCGLILERKNYGEAGGRAERLAQLAEQAYKGCKQVHLND